MSRARAGPDRASTSGVLEGRVRDVAYGGEGVVETAAGLVFVAGVIAGERVLVRDVRRSGGALRGSLVRVLDASGDRVEPRCPLVGACGGCPLAHLTVAAQHALKRRWLVEALGCSPDAVELEAPAPPWGHRRRARLRWSDGRIGFLRRRSNRLVDVPSCAALEPVLDAALGRLRESLGPWLRGAGEIRLAESLGEVVVALDSPNPQPPALYACAERLAAEPPFAGIAMRLGGAGPVRHGRTVEWRQGDAGERLEGTELGFSQASSAAEARLRALVRELARPEGRRVLELYAGYGNLTVPLARGAKRLLAVERDAQAAAACERNLRRAGLSHARVVCAEAERWVETFRERVDVVVLDPPRGGAVPVLGRLVALAPDRIVHVSCDLGTLRRDVERLRAGGYELERAVGLDMFPQTAQLEAVVALRRGARAAAGRRARAAL
ncbi:MAG: RsmD family RNA methyltransferase [Myxococcota bacterium]|nr:RsmD family RNA methyltransferase [Myxococcota bacterium]MDW8363561.1 RsmD family RNA methyltransferase [Myxococcales bacterium]